MAKAKAANPTTEIYKRLVEAFDFFNKELFDNELPHCIITISRTKRAKGFFWGRTWQNEEGEFVDEISLNPDCFERRALADVLSTFVHEQVHGKQHHYGTPSRTGYHNWQFAHMMEAVGLMTSSTGAPDGKRIGQRMTHYIIDGGPFDVACQKLLKKGFALPWLAITSEKADKPKPKKKSNKTKYTCEDCGLNMWGKPNSNVICGDCALKMVEEGGEADLDQAA